MSTTSMYLTAVCRHSKLQNRFALPPPLAGAILGMLLVLGCKNPCKELADKVCSCKSTLTEQHACQTNINARKRFYEIPRTENEQECQRILDAKTCTCNALDLGHIEGCGMTRAPSTTQSSEGATAQEVP